MTTGTTTITIHCPFHGDIETITIPSAYIETGFKGEVQCKPKSPRDEVAVALRIEIVRGDVLSVERVR